MDNNNRILVVDDKPDLTTVSTLALEYHGFKVDTHRTHEQGHYLKQIELECRD
jgi:DNA-binding response OmpR family regulator